MVRTPTVARPLELGTLSPRQLQLEHEWTASPLRAQLNGVKSHAAALRAGQARLPQSVRRPNVRTQV